jgi:hypothetical protein
MKGASASHGTFSDRMREVVHLITLPYVKLSLIGKGGHLTVPPLPTTGHVGHVPRRFDRIELGRGRGVWKTE